MLMISWRILPAHNWASLAVIASTCQFVANPPRGLSSQMRDVQSRRDPPAAMPRTEPR
jgi:hypothetical protein